MDRTEEFVTYACRTRPFTQGYKNVGIRKYFDINIWRDNQVVEVPDFCLNGIETMRHLNIGIISYKLLEPLGHPTPRRLVRGALSDFMQTAMSLRAITGVQMSNGTIYYGIPGVIFDSDYNILFLMTTSVECTDTGYSLIRHNCRVSPVVFSNQGNIIEKTIVKKMIPYCAQHTTKGHEYPFWSIEYKREIIDTDIKIIIEDVNKLFLRDTVAPNAKDFTQDKVNAILRQNIDYILG